MVHDLVIAYQVPNLGFDWAMRGKSIPFHDCLLAAVESPVMAFFKVLSIGEALKLTLPVLALVSLLTLLPANILARSPRRPRQQKVFWVDWTIFRDKPFVLMLSGK